MEADSRSLPIPTTPTPNRLSGAQPRPARVLQPGVELAADLPADPCGEHVVVVRKEPAHRRGIPDRQLTQGPRQRLDDHVVTVRDQPATDVQGAGGVAGP